MAGRTFLLCNLSGRWEIHAQVLAYDPKTGRMRVRVPCGIEYDRYFLADSKYNRRDFLIRNEDDDAQLPELQARHSTGDEDREEAG
jgi:hypothetical protein